MSKEALILFNNILSHLIQDVEDIVELERGTMLDDFDRIIRSSKSRGQARIFLVRFPELCSDFELSLESGLLRFSDGEFLRHGKLTIFQSLISRIFDENHCIKDEPCLESIRCFRQLTKFAKKYRIDCEPEKTKEKILEFRSIETELPEPSYTWGSTHLASRGSYPSLIELDTESVSSNGEFSGSSTEWCEGGLFRDLSYIQYVADRLCKSFCIHWERFNPRHGPGAVSEKFRDSKYEFPSWPERLDNVFPFSKWGVFNELNIPLEEYIESQPAKLIDVPKDFKGPRLIASEPISSQFIQQGIMQSVRESLSKSPLRNCYDPLSQQHSKDLVLTSSESRSFSTIDLSSASDRLSCWLVERIFRNNNSFLQALNAARTPDILYPDGSIERLKKFAAQGAAFTFPIQSLVYSIIAVGVIYSSNTTARFNDIVRKVRVYGDDIIVPTEYFSRVCRALEACFLKVNHKKSFSKGYFRESCGMDGYKGFDVTPVSVLAFYHARRPLNTISVIECSNNLYLRGFIRASNALLETIPMGLRKDLPWCSPGQSDQLCVFGSGKPNLRTRWDHTWHQPDCRVLVVENKVKRTRPSWQHSLHQWFLEKPRPDINWVSGEVSSVKARYRLRWVPSYMLGMRYNRIKD